MQWSGCWCYIPGGIWRLTLIVRRVFAPYDNNLAIAYQRPFAICLLLVLTDAMARKPPARGAPMCFPENYYPSIIRPNQTVLTSTDACSARTTPMPCLHQVIATLYSIGIRANAATRPPHNKSTPMHTVNIHACIL